MYAIAHLILSCPLARAWKSRHTADLVHLQLMSVKLYYMNYSAVSAFQEIISENHMWFSAHLYIGMFYEKAGPLLKACSLVKWCYPSSYEDILRVFSWAIN